MNWLHDRIKRCAHDIDTIISRHGFNAYEEELEKYAWTNIVWKSSQFRRAHLQVIDKEERGVLIVHATVFPHIDDPSPIWGFDIVAGKQKVTGAFLDYSPTGPSQLNRWFKHKVQDLGWNKPREMPEWAKAIFSDNIVAAGNIQSEEEIEQFITVGLETLAYYLEHVGEERRPIGQRWDAEHNHYCQKQKENPHVITSMVSMGYDRSEIEEFVDKVLFPEIA